MSGVIHINAHSCRHDCTKGVTRLRTGMTNGHCPGYDHIRLSASHRLIATGTCRRKWNSFHLNHVSFFLIDWVGSGFFPPLLSCSLYIAELAAGSHQTS